MKSGLEDVIAAETVLSDVRGGEGKLIIRGHPLGDLAGRKSFEQVAHLLFTGFFDDLPDEAMFKRKLAEARCEAFEATRPLLAAVGHLPAYDAMRALVAMTRDGTGSSDALHLLAAPAVILPALILQFRGQAPIAPSTGLGHADDIVRMLGRQGGGRALDTYLVVVADHGLNASTFAARVVSSTQAGLTSAVLAGLGALKGPLHGGAPGPVIDMLDAIETDGNVACWLERALDHGERLMGFGHRVYRTRDPRANALKAALRGFDQVDARLRFAEQVEQVALDLLRRRKPDRVIETNVEFYTALLLEAVGFPPDSFTGVFAMGRIAGWIAHAREQALTGRLIRPASRYLAEKGKDVVAA